MTWKKLSFITDHLGKPITSPANIHAGGIIDRFGPSGRMLVRLKMEKIIAFNKRGLPYPEGIKIIINMK